MPLTSSSTPTPYAQSQAQVTPCSSVSPTPGSSHYTTHFNKGLTPPEDLLPSDWADKYRMLPKEAANEYGKYRISRTPYMKVPLDCLSPESSVRIVTFKKATQVGCTDGIGINWTLFVAMHCPRPMIIMLPTVELAKRHSKTKVSKSLDAMPCMNGLIRDAKSARNIGDTILMKEFPGGSWSFIGSNSASACRSVSAPYIILDDMDGYEPDVGGEGPPDDLIKKRSDSFSSIAKWLQISTPTLKEVSKIDLQYELSDQSAYHVPCPYCGFGQILQWGGKDADFGMKWDKDTVTGDLIKESVQYLCINCHKFITEGYKTEMLANGLWIAKHPERSNEHRGFWLSSLYSPLGWLSWAAITKEFLEAQGNKEKQKVWRNTRMGLSWEEKGSQPSWLALRNRAEEYKIGSVPTKGLFLTGSVDVQEDRLEVKIKAWGRGEESWLILYTYLYGDTKESEVWDKLSEILFAEYSHTTGVGLRVLCTCIDSGFRTQEVYSYVRKHSRLGVIATKGKSTTGNPIIGRPSKQDIDYKGEYVEKGVLLWPLGTDTTKTIVYDRMDITTPGPKMLHFPVGLDDSYYRQLTAEVRVTRYNTSGFPERRWILPSGKRNEALDLECLAYTAAVHVGISRINWGVLEQSFAKVANAKDPDPIGGSTPDTATAPNKQSTTNKRKHSAVRSNYIRR